MTYYYVNQKHWKVMYMSCESCGCDPEAKYVCARHQDEPIIYNQYSMKDVRERLGPQEDFAFAVKDSGARQVFDSGMQRDVTTDKIDYSLIFDGPMLERWAAHLTKGAKKYTARNWMKADGEEEYQRFKESAARHFVQWMRGDVDEDHASAVVFNLNGAEYVRARMVKLVEEFV